MVVVDFDTAKAEVAELVKKLDDVIASGSLKNYNEENTKKDFITPLFRILGWDTENKYSPDEVTNEDKVSKGRVDYAFRINGIPKFFLEAKSLSKGLDISKDAFQSINYSWHKGTVWALLTDFKTLIVYNAEIKEANPSNAQFFSLTYDQFLDNFDRLWLLSKPAMVDGLLDKAALTWGKRFKKTKVDDQLLRELMYYREKLSKNIKKNNVEKNLSDDEIDEAVQKIIDRLIFIRTTEDREIEPPYLSPIIRAFNEKKTGEITKALNVLYQSFDKVYNSKLFSFNLYDFSQRHLCESLAIDNDVIVEIIEGLYNSRDGITHYDFSAIDADVLGNIYEQYLSQILRSTEKRVIIENKEAHRHDQGIYYTPTYIVDYIVNNTINHVLNNKTPIDADALRVLDMACGSGSFLIKAFDHINKFYNSFDKNNITQAKTEDSVYKVTRKTNILRHNLYGVDLDPKAVEIAQLNLLLKTAETKHRLPDLRDNIRRGNSLIDDPTVAGANSFSWTYKFANVMKEGGFDIIIGNPPYIFARNQTFDDNVKQYYYNNYKLQKYQLNTYGLFVERAYSLLKPGGHLGFIIPNNWLTIDTFSDFRNFILTNCADIKIVNIYDKVFQEANVDTCLLIFKKNAPNNVALYEMRDGSLESIGDFKAKDIVDAGGIINISGLKNNSTLDIIQKIEKQSFEIQTKATVSTGLKAYQIGKGTPKQTEHEKSGRVFHSYKKESLEYLPYLEGKDVGRYNLSWSGQYLKYGEHLAEPRRSVPFHGARILVRQIPSKPPYCINAVITGQDYLHDINSMVIFNISTEYDPRYILGILNSKLISYWFYNKFGKLQRVLFPQFKVKELKKFILPNQVSEKDSNDLIALVQSNLDLNVKLNSIKDKQTDEKSRLLEEIKITNDQIDKLVYKIYLITDEEQKIIENI